MNRRRTETLAAIIAFLDEVAPERKKGHTGNAIALEWFRWLPAGAVRLFYDTLAESLGERVVAGRTNTATETAAAADRFAVIDRDFGERLAALDQVRTSHRSLRAGWLFVAGRTHTASGQSRRVFQPLVTVPVRVDRGMGFGRTRLVPAGDAELSSVITDRHLRHQLEARLEFGGGSLETIHQSAVPKALLARLPRLHEFAFDAAGAAGWDPTALVPAGTSAEQLLRADGLVVVAGVGVYADTASSGQDQGSVLGAWRTALPERSAFTSLYLPDDSELRPDGEGVGAPAAGDGPFVLTPAQTEAVTRARREPITVLSGAAGTGKSHTIAAVACDAVARGESVLVAAKSDSTVDALLDLLARAPGLDPVVFGSDERRDRLAARLASGQHQPVAVSTVEKAKGDLQAAVTERDTLISALFEDLAAEEALEQTAAEGETLAPTPAVDVGRLEAFLARATVTGGWRWRRRASRARAELRAVAGTDEAAAVKALIEASRTAGAATALLARGGLDLAPQWSAVVAATGAVRHAAARRLALDTHSAARFKSATLPAVAALATALRSGRSARRVQLARLSDDRLTDALPLWVGTLADVEDLLPPVPGLFDLVILDESSSIEQPLAAPALLRGCRALIVGDPHQLRHVSFLADEAVDAALLRHELRDDAVLAARLDVRRNSIFDVAVGAAPVVQLGEEFRSVPHLVRFLGERVYGGGLVTATTTPANECQDAIDVVRIDGRRQNEVVEAEVRAVVRELRNLRHDGHHSVGVITPFRQQAEAIETAVLAAFSVDDIEALDLRIGTVHGFQGNEREIVLASMALDRESPAASWRFVNDEQLFTVLVSRARRRLVVFLSADPPPGLLADFLAQADVPPPPPPEGPPTAWSATLADHLRTIGVPVRLNYPVGRHTIDLCIGDRYRFAAIETGVHPDGPAAHVARRLALHDAGWEVFEAYRSRWGGRAAERAIELAAALGWPRHP